MTTNQTISWIFLSIAMASQSTPANTKSISEVADGINHVVPTEKEMRTSLLFLIKNGWIEKKHSAYQLTKKGAINIISLPLKRI